MDDPDQSPLVSSTTAAAAAEQGRRQPQQPLFQYQFVREPEDDEEDEDEDEELDDEQLEVRERKPAAAPPAPPTSPPLMGRGASGEQPPSPPPFPQPAWASPPVVPTAAAAAPVAAAAQDAPPGQKDREPPRSAPPPPPHREEPRAPAIPPRSAPLPPKREEPSAAKKGAAPASPDETLFALPVAPLMHSSADKGMDLQEQLGHACSASQEDFAAASLDATASLPSLSTLSANPFKEYAALDTLSDGLSAKYSYSEIGSDVFKVTTKTAQNPFLADDGGEIANLKPSYAGDHSFCLSQIKEPLDAKGIPDTEELSICQQDSPLESPVELFAEQDKSECLEEGKHAIYDHGENMTLVDNHYSRDEYADLKPFELSWVSNESINFKDVSENELDNKLGSVTDKCDVKNVKTLPAHKVTEKENESSNEDISFPTTPEASNESSQSYITCAKLEPSEKIEGNMVTSLPLIEEKASENKTDEKKIAEMMDQFVSTHIDLASGQGQKADSKKEENLLKKVSDANVPEGLTPDLVQEAFESELHDVICPKLAYETKIDLVQTSESSQESLNVAVQLCPSFEGGSEASPSPVLPDIVMEAPLPASSAVVGGPPVQLDISPFETFTAPDEYENDYENVIQKSEKPPSYQEAMNVPVIQAKEAKVEAAKKPDSENNAPLEDLDTSYISIACDLVKESKVSSSEFAGYSKGEIPEYVSQPVSEYTEHPERTLLPSEKSYSFSSQPEVNLVQKEEAVKGSSFETTMNIVPNRGQEEKYKEVQSPLSEPYLESFQPQLEPLKNEPTTWCLEAADLAKKEKTPQQHMEELSTYTGGFPVFKEPIMKDKTLLSAQSSPEADDTVPFQVDKLMRSTEDILKENESRKSYEALQAEVIPSAYQEVAQDLSLKNIHIKIEEQDLSLEKPSEDLDREAAREHLPPTDVIPLLSEKKVVSVRREAESQDASVKEKEKPLSVFSSKLSERSVVDLLYWRDVKKTGVVFGASLFLLLSLTVFSIVSVVAYIALTLLSVTISFRIYKGVIQAVQKSDEGHPFRAYLNKDVAVSEELVQKYSHVTLGHLNSTVKELRRLFLVDDLVDSLKFAVLMWVFTYVGALFNGLTLLILALISLFSIPVIYEKHQAQIDHYVELVNKNVKDAVAKVQAKIPGLKRKTE